MDSQPARNRILIVVVEPSQHGTASGVRKIQPKMTINRRYRSYRILGQVSVLDVDDSIGAKQSISNIQEAFDHLCPPILKKRSYPRFTHTRIMVRPKVTHDACDRRN